MKFFQVLQIPFERLITKTKKTAFSSRTNVMYSAFSSPKRLLEVGQEVWWFQLLVR